jgi:hypothetical protein
MGSDTAASIDTGSQMDGDDGAGGAEAFCFLMDSMKHLEQQSPVASLPKNPHPILQGLLSASGETALAVVFA